MLGAPFLYAVMHAIEQKKQNLFIPSIVMNIPLLFCIIWDITSKDGYMPLYAGSGISVAYIFLMLIMHLKEYRRYVKHINSEYSDNTGRHIEWSLYNFLGFAIQLVTYIAYELSWSPLLEIIYTAFCVANVTCLYLYTIKQRTIDLDLVQEKAEDILIEDQKDETALFEVIKDKLKTHCEDKFLFVDPNLSLETLCTNLSTNRTYLGMYFRRREISFYKYINTLRVEYALN